MTHTIKNKRADNDTLFVTVEYTFTEKEDGIDAVKEVEIACFQPESVEEIGVCITNRASSELRALLAAKKIQEEILAAI